MGKHTSSFVREHFGGRPDLIRRAYEAAGLVFNGKHSGDEWRTTCPFHADTDESPNLDVNFAKATFLCRVCKKGGDAITFYIERKGVAMEAAMAELRAVSGEVAAAPLKRRRLAATYEYKAKDGTLLYEVLRYDPK